MSHNIFLLQSDKNGIFKPPGRVLDAYFFRLSKTWHFISVRVKWSYHFGRKRWPFHTGQNYALYKYASRSTSMGVVMNNISCKIILLINMPPPSNTHTHIHIHTYLHFSNVASDRVKFYFDITADMGFPTSSFDWRFNKVEAEGDHIVS